MKHLPFLRRLSGLIFTVVTLGTVIFLQACSSGQKEKTESEVDLTRNDRQKRIDVTVDGQPFTSYLYSDTIDVMKKTVLYPVYAADGNIVTRGYPLKTRPGERMDHPHHIGFWLNYGDVNGLDFWGHSNATPPERANAAGTIRNHSIDLMEGGRGSGTLKVTENWLKPDGNPILKENTTLIFRAAGNQRIIDRITTLTALDDTVRFQDTKEGMMAIRTARAFEFPSDKPLQLADAQGNKTEVPVMDNKAATGSYINSNGVTGTDVWGKRADWCALSGKMDGKTETLIIFDHPGNVGYPSYWHARGYGLFAINPLGQHTFSDGKETLNFSLPPGKSVTFKYRLAVVSGTVDRDGIEKMYRQFQDQVK